MTLRILILTLSAVLLTGCAQEPAPPAEIQGIPVSVQAVGLMDFTETAYFIGKLASSEEFDIPTGQAGTIQRVLVKPGDRVSKGQPLFVIEHNQLLDDLGSQETQLQNQVQLTQLQLAEAQKQYDNTRTLLDQGAESQDALDQARLRLEQAQFSASNAQEILRSTSSRLRNQIADATVKSPVSGIVASSDIQAGQEAGNITAMKIVGSASMVVEASVPESIIPKVRVGQRATVSFGENGSEATTGRVIRVDAVPGSQSRLYGVRIQLDAVDSTLRSGMYAEVALITAEIPQRIGIPKSALRKDDSGHFVVTEVQGKAFQKAVRTGVVNGEAIEILEGLTTEDILIVKGQTYLKDGDPLRITP